MKKLLVVLGIILSTGVVALSLNKKTEVKPVVQKVDKTVLTEKGYSDFKSDIANAD